MDWATINTSQANSWNEIPTASATLVIDPAAAFAQGSFAAGSFAGNGGNVQIVFGTPWNVIATDT
jgi:hypothetical protein